jgi:hypothetical protein
MGHGVVDVVGGRGGGGGGFGGGGGGGGFGGGFVVVVGHPFPIRSQQYSLFLSLHEYGSPSQSFVVVV